MAEPKVGLAGYMGLAVVAALNLALIEGATGLLTLPTIATFLVLLDLALARLLIWRRPLSAFDYGFMVVGFVAAVATFPFNNNPYIFRGAVNLYRQATGQPRIFAVRTASIVYRERAILGLLILGSALAGGALAARMRRSSRRPGRTRDADLGR